MIFIWGIFLEKKGLRNCNLDFMFCEVQFADNQKSVRISTDGANNKF